MPKRATAPYREGSLARLRIMGESVLPRIHWNLVKRRSAGTDGPTQPPVTDSDLVNASTSDEISMTLSAQRTALSFQRTRMSADSTLMSEIRTSISLIGFGFTIYQAFQAFAKTMGTISVASAKTFGMALVLMGIAMVGLGIWYHISFMVDLRARRRAMIETDLIVDTDQFPVSLTVVIALFLLLLGLYAIVSMVFKIGIAV